jgi:hypothetical protein
MLLTTPMANPPVERTSARSSCFAGVGNHDHDRYAANMMPAIACSPLFPGPMHARITIALFLVICSVAAVIADTKIVLPHSQRFAESGSDFLLETMIPGDFKTLEGVVWAVLALSPQCPDKHFFSPFFPDAISSTSPGEGAQPLYMYYRGLQRDGRRVILSFTGEANRYLNNTAAIQECVKGALEKTIKLHTSKSTTVDYEIDGEIVEDWDA